MPADSDEAISIRGLPRPSLGSGLAMTALAGFSIAVIYCIFEPAEPTTLGGHGLLRKGEILLPKVDIRESTAFLIRKTLRFFPLISNVESRMLYLTKKPAC